jgi:hypothetical protein
MKHGKQIKKQIRRIAAAIQTRIDFIQQTGQLHRRAFLQKRFAAIVDAQASLGLKPAFRLMRSENYVFLSNLDQ